MWLHLLQNSINRFTKLTDLAAVSHLDGKRNCLSALPVAVLIPPVVIVQKRRGRLISGHDLSDIAKIDRRAGGGFCKRRIAYLVRACIFPDGLDQHI